MTSRTFLYARVSTDGQTTDNQVKEVEDAGFSIKQQRVIAETISGRVPASERPAFSKLLDRLEEGDTLVVTKLDRLGRNTTDVVGTVEKLASMGVHVHCLALKGTDLTSPAGKLHMTILAAVAAFERDLLVERTHAGLARAKAQGKVLGRKKGLAKYAEDNKLPYDTVVAEVTARRAAGESLRELGKAFGVSGQTILRELGPDNAASRNVAPD
jgi:putative DNA-invertase from lambdoid prophage Rac